MEVNDKGEVFLSEQDEQNLINFGKKLFEEKSSESNKEELLFEGVAVAILKQALQKEQEKSPNKLQKETDWEILHIYNYKIDNKTSNQIDLTNNIDSTNDFYKPTVQTILSGLRK